MARPLRVEYPGARYHVMCRGNQSRDIFEGQEDADLFVRCLGEMCVRNQAVVHAWCLMSNHYPLLLGTPRSNLVDAMKWFQGTFTQRYNARHKLSGHLFQERYKAKVIDDEDSSCFRRVSDYIHLNPVDAGVVKSGHLIDYCRWLVNVVVAGQSSAIAKIRPQRHKGRTLHPIFRRGVAANGREAANRWLNLPFVAFLHSLLKSISFAVKKPPFPFPFFGSS